MTSKCKICSTHRALDSHLFELSEFCRFLNNYATYEANQRSRIVKTETIGSWLRLAAELEKVNIDSWKFDDGLGSMYCEPIADENDSNSKHYSNYTTDLTRFLYVSFALEETYRFFVSKYKHAKVDYIKKLREPSLQAAVLLSKSKNLELPQDFKHICDNLKTAFYLFDKDFQLNLTGIKENEMNVFGLHLVRNIRNYVAHGVLPIAENPDYFHCSEPSTKVSRLLLLATRTAAVYIQLFLYESSHGFTSVIVNQIENDEYEFDRHYFKENCTKRLLLNLHKENNFTFLEPKGNMPNDFYID